ncbi:MAG: ADP-ribosylglycohydrolase, partial [Oleiphilaceae bacterium]
MLGGIVGDIAGSILENGDQQLRTYNLTTDSIFSPRAVPTDDSVLLAATGAAMLDNSDDFELYYKKFAERHPDAGYGPGFQLWLNGDSQEYQSFGNGAASRAGILGYLDNEQDVLQLARKSAIVSHKHPEGIAGAEAMAWCVWAIRHEYSREEIRLQVYKRWNYYIGRDSYDLKAIHKDAWNFDCSAVNTVPLALHIALFRAHDYESAIRTCQYLGGDVDTIACMAGLLKSQECMINGEWTRRSKQKLWLVAPKILDVVERFDA